MDYIERSLDLAREFREFPMYESKFHPADECRDLCDIMDEFDDVEYLWYEAVHNVKGVYTLDLVWDKFDDALQVELVELACEGGVEGMLAAYYAGVPVEDIVA